MRVFYIYIYILRILTRLDAAVYVRSGLVVDPVEASLDGQSREHSVLGTIAIARRHVHRSALVVQRVRRVFALLVPALGNPELHPRPLIHHGDRQSVEFLFAPLKNNYE